MKTANLRIWEQVDKTDPEFTKSYKGKGGFEGSALNATEMHRRATELWGPCGDGWGYEILQETVIRGAPLGVYPGTEKLIWAKTHTMKVRLWYKDTDGEQKSVVHYGHTDLVYMDKFGYRTEPEPSKKSLTDALKKCLSMLGFSADVFMGKFDDADYVEEQANRAALEKADNRAEELQRQETEYKRWLHDHSELIKTATSIHELESLFKLVIRKLKLRNANEAIVTVTRLKDARKQQLEKKP